MNYKSLNLERLIYSVNGVQVMLDSDLALLYGVETKRINEAVKNNPDKFPGRYAFRIAEQNFNYLKSKKSTSNKIRGGSRKGHTVFTEQGVAMLATILKSKVAVQVSIKIMDTFVIMRKYIASLSENNFRIGNLESKVIDHDCQIYKILSLLETKEVVNHIFFEGQIYDAYSLLIDILSKAKKEILIIDNYIDKTILDVFSKLNVPVLIITKEINLIDLEKYKTQYGNIKFIFANKFHDRFILIDEKKLYHCGASFKDLGKKCFAINEICDSELIENLKKSFNK